MADVIQAAKWMKEGKGVRRKIIPDWTYSITSDGYLLGGSIDSYQSSDNMIDVEDLLADDWEVVE